MDTSIDVGISFVMSSVSSSSRKRRQTDAEQAKTTEETAQQPATTTAPEPAASRDEKAFAISLLDNAETTTGGKATGKIYCT